MEIVSAKHPADTVGTLKLPVRAILPRKAEEQYLLLGKKMAAITLQILEFEFVSANIFRPLVAFTPNPDLCNVLTHCPMDICQWNIVIVR